VSATTTQLLSSGEFCKLRYDTIPVKSASVNVSFCSNKSKMPNFELRHSCRKWTLWSIWTSPKRFCYGRDHGYHHEDLCKQSG